MQHMPDAPALSLSDIMHTMSPSPAPQPLPPEPSYMPNTHFSLSLDSTLINHAPIMHHTQSRPRSTSPEPFDHSEIESMRARIHQLGLAPSDPTTSQVNPRECELATMVLRLTSHLLLQPSPAQLASQAETIANLTLQRNLLLHEKEEEHARWAVEREGWDRTAEALLARRRATRDPAEKDHDTERQVARLADDNRILRYKLAEVTDRMSSLQSELSRLRPFLAMQPTLLHEAELWRGHTPPPVTQRPEGDIKDRPADVKGKGKRKARREKEKVPKAEINVSIPAEIPAAVGEDVEMATNAPLVDAPDAPDVPPPAGVDLGAVVQPPSDSQPPDAQLPSQAAESGDIPAPVPEPAPEPAPAPPVKPERRKREKDADREREKERKLRHKQLLEDKAVPILSDARAEFILVAARKLGRVRAGIIAGFIKEREREAEKERERERELQREKEDPEVARMRRVGLRPRPAPDADGAGPSTQFIAYHGPVAPTPAPTTRRGSARRIAGSPFSAPGVTLMRGPPLPSHLHPSHQPYPPGQGHHAMIPHPGIIYVNALPGMPGGSGPQGGPMPVLVPIPPGAWPVPGTPTNVKSQPQPQPQPQPQSQVGTPARGGTTEDKAGPTTPMDSLVSAARTLMVDEDYDGDGDGGGAGADEDDTDVEESPAKRAGTRRRGAAATAESPLPKRRRVVTADGTTAAASSSTVASGAKTGKGAKDAVQEKGKGKARGKGRRRKYQARVQGVRQRRQSAMLRLVLLHSYQAAQEQERRPSVDPGSRRESVEPEKRHSFATSASFDGVFGAVPLAEPPRRRSDSLSSVSGRSKGKERADNSVLPSVDVPPPPPAATQSPFSSPPPSVPPSLTPPHGPDPQPKPLPTRGVGPGPSMRRPPSAPPPSSGTNGTSMGAWYTVPRSQPVSGPVLLQELTSKPSDAPDQELDSADEDAEGSIVDPEPEPEPSTPPNTRGGLRTVSEEPSPRTKIWRRNGTPPSYLASNGLQGTPAEDHGVVRPIPVQVPRVREIEVIPVQKVRSGENGSNPPEVHGSSSLLQASAPRVDAVKIRALNSGQDPQVTTGRPENR
ncbi:hypothetical protein A0H81_09744 [Grifola frondosa]|uniref:Uncharacterized protein n=1 Tax=Grifola frondosa TaxID=5627 RepID=A0A1C7M200_GRIFR|nr:hypothetical protein A0H81_09744 [Grifola frondosa]